MYSILLALPVALAIPQPASTDDNKPIPFTVPPPGGFTWLEPTGYTDFERNVCGIDAIGKHTTSVEECWGTLKFCKEGLWGGFDRAGVDHKENYASSEACLKARAPKPVSQPISIVPPPGGLTWLEPMSSSWHENDLCSGAAQANHKISVEECWGTLKFCNEGLWGEFDRAGVDHKENYASSEECLTARQRPQNTASSTKKICTPKKKERLG